MSKVIQKNNLLAVRVEPWQLFRFKKLVQYLNKRPGLVIQEALQVYFSQFPIADSIIKNWIDEYNKLKGSAE